MWRFVPGSRHRPARTASSSRLLAATAALLLSVGVFQVPATADSPSGDGAPVTSTVDGGPTAKSALAPRSKARAEYEVPDFDPQPLTRKQSGEAPEQPDPVSYAGFEPGIRALLEDLQSGTLNEEAFINHAYATLGYLGGVPAHYRDSAKVPQEQRQILAMVLGRELARLGHPIRDSVKHELDRADQLTPFISRSSLRLAPTPSTECQQASLPGDFQCLHQTSHFSVFYRTTGERNVDTYDGAGDPARGDVAGNGVPNYVERLSRSLEVSWTTYTSDLGYHPREDTDKKVAVFLGSPHVDSGVGFVQPYETADANIIHIGTDYGAGDEADEFYLPRHELFHTMQYGYIGIGLVFNPRDLNAWMEGSAEWAAHQAMQNDSTVPSASNAKYAKALDSYFARPGVDLTQQDGFGSGHQYGTFIFAEFLEERLGRDSIRRTWERIDDAWFPDAKSQIRDMIEDDYHSDPHTQFSDYWIANYQLCGGGSAADYGTYWHYADKDVPVWCSELRGTGSDSTFSVPRPAHETVRLPADTGVASGSYTVHGGGAHFVDLVGQADPSKLWNMAVRTMQDDDRRLTFRVVDWQEIPKRCYADDVSAREEDKTLDTRIGGRDCYRVTLLISHGQPDEDEEEGRWETKYTSLFGGSIGGAATEVEIGVQPGGNLITPSGRPSAGVGTTDLGLRHKPTNYEGVSVAGCFCEGWGIEVTPPGGVGQWAGWSHGVQGLSDNAEIVEFSTTATTAKSVVRLVGTDYPITVTHEYRPSSRPELYDVKVTVASEAPPGDQPSVVYRRVVDWDVEPTPLNEYVTLKADHDRVVFASDDGLAGPNPLTGRPWLHNSGSFTDAGPYDQGTLLDIDVPVDAVAGQPGTSGSFDLYYGAAGDQQTALAALGAVNAPVYSLAKPSTAGNPAGGSPVTFVLGYKP
ncbi:hypothetical protein ACWERY_33195 [Streptomyces sp. NPDC004082]